jgi:hypothetical protein
LTLSLRDGWATDKSCELTMAGRRSPCKLEWFRTDPPREVCGLLDVSGNIDGDGSTLSAFTDAEQFERARIADLISVARSANAVTTYLWTVAVAAEPTLGRAPFCLQADGEIRKQTGKRQRYSGGLQGVLRADNRAGWMIEAPRPSFRDCDQATSTRTRREFPGNNLRWIHIKLFNTYTPRRKGWTGLGWPPGLRQQLRHWFQFDDKCSHSR